MANVLHVRGERQVLVGALVGLAFPIKEFLADTFEVMSKLARFALAVAFSPPETDGVFNHWRYRCSRQTHECLNGFRGVSVRVNRKFRNVGHNTARATSTIVSKELSLEGLVDPHLLLRWHLRQFALIINKTTTFIPYQHVPLQ